MTSFYYTFKQSQRYEDEQTLSSTMILSLFFITAQIHIPSIFFKKLKNSGCFNMLTHPQTPSIVPQVIFF